MVDPDVDSKLLEVQLLGKTLDKIIDMQKK